MELRRFYEKIINMRRGKNVPFNDRLITKMIYWLKQKAKENSRIAHYLSSGITGTNTVEGFMYIDYKRPRSKVIITIKHELMHCVAGELSPIFANVPHGGFERENAKLYFLSEGFATWGSFYLLRDNSFREKLNLTEQEFIVKFTKMKNKYLIGNPDSIDRAYLLSMEFFRQVHTKLGIGLVIQVMKNPQLVTTQDIFKPDNFINGHSKWIRTTC